jgi:hypothetical protein
VENRRKLSEPPEDGDTTQRSRALEILASIADRALDTGRLQDAEDLLKTTLLDVAQESSLGHMIEPDSLEFAVTYSLKLATAQGKNRWFDYALDLLKGQRALCTKPFADALISAMAKLPSVDAKRIDAYLAVLRQLKGLDAESAITRVEEVRQAAARREKHA